MQKRQVEWNTLIDKYMNDSGDDSDGRCMKDQLSGQEFRNDLQIEIAAKVSVTDGPLYHACGNAECARVEIRPSLFMLCRFLSLCSVSLDPLQVPVCECVCLCLCVFCF